MSGLYHIPAQNAFMAQFVAGFTARLRQSYDLDKDPLAMSRQIILLPTRRAGRALRDAFLRANNGQSQILPKIIPLGDVNDDELASQAAFLGFDKGLEIPPALGGLDREIRLSRLILAWDQNRPSSQATHNLGQNQFLQTQITPGQMTPDQAMRLARELARFLDHAQTEECPFDKLHDLVPEDYANHWQESLAFLSILTDLWPTILAEKQAIDPATRSIMLIRGQAAIWQKHPPTDWVIAAGITGSIPATTDLLKVILALPKGAIVLPALDQFSDDHSWAGFSQDPCHPQYGFTQLCQKLEISRHHSQIWYQDPEQTENILPVRSYLLAQALHPATAPQQFLPHLTVPDFKAQHPLKGFDYLTAETLEEEAGMIALIMRQTLETSEKTAALVTTDRMLARRVAAALKKWDIAIDDSAGYPLPETEIGVFLRLITRVIQDDFPPILTLSLLKHPLTSLGYNPIQLRILARLLDHSVLRGPRPARGITGLRQALTNALTTPTRTQRLTSKQATELTELLDQLEKICQPLCRLQTEKETSLSALMTAHLECAEKLAQSDTHKGADRLWRGEEGDITATLIADILQNAPLLPPISPLRYAAMFDAFLVPHVVRPKYGLHPRLFIWGPLEARLQQPDIVILGGVNEGHFPLEQDPDPWLSLQMRAEFGLPPLTQKIGQAAHDFWQLCHSPQIYLTRSLKADGTPTTASRWLQRLEAICTKYDLAWGQETLKWQKWHHQLSAPALYRPCPRPAPCPPLTERPTRFSVSRIETLRTDPYAVYAQYILGLSALPLLDADPSLAERGTILHQILHRFLSETPQTSLAALQQIGREEFEKAHLQPSVWSFWWPRFERFSQWFFDNHLTRLPDLRQSLTEIKGSWQITLKNSDYILSAIADRIDVLNSGQYVLIDYKTATLPSAKSVINGYKPQLPLEALIAEKGHFISADPESRRYQGNVARLEYWRVSGGIIAGDIQNALGKKSPPPIADILSQTEAGLLTLLEYFNQPDSCYWAEPNPEMPLAYNDYAHLARLGEWQDQIGEGKSDVPA